MRWSSAAITNSLFNALRRSVVILLPEVSLLIVTFTATELNFLTYILPCRINDSPRHPPAALGFLEKDTGSNELPQLG